jgi:hypothetical protein
MEAVVAGDGGSGELARVDGRAVEGGHDADAVGLDAMHAQQVRRHAVRRCRLPGDDVEQRGVDAIRARGDDRELAALLAAPGEERARVLERVAGDRTAQDPLAAHGLAVGGHDQPDLTLRDHRHRRLGDGVLPLPVCEVHAGRERLGLVAGLAVEGDQPSDGQRPVRELLDHDADLPLADHHHSPPQRRGQQHEHDQGGDERVRQHERREEGCHV